MKTGVGVWIDHRKANIVALTETGEAATLVIAKAEKQLRRTGDSPLKGNFESRKVPAPDSRQKTFTMHLNLYYDAVIGVLRSAGGILIFGPGEAKGELKKRLVKNKLGARIAGVETADKMTIPQIAAKVRNYFRPRPAPQPRPGARNRSRAR